MKLIMSQLQGGRRGIRGDDGSVSGAAGWTVDCAASCPASGAANGEVSCSVAPGDSDTISGAVFSAGQRGSGCDGAAQAGGDHE